MNRSESARLLILGLDGATWDLLTPMIARDWLPNLAHLVAGGAIAPLRSTIPPLTAPAWSSFMTGLNPGRHGVFAFQRALNRDLERTYVNAAAIRGPLLWEHLNRHGLTVGVLNVPLTYPLRPVDGWAVSGMLTPSEESDFTWPTELATVLRARGYTIDLRVLVQEREYRRPDQRLALVEDLRRVLLERQAALEEVLLPRGGDAIMVVYETPDRLQHWTWSYLADLLGDAPFERTPIHDAVEAAYRGLDECIGRTLAAVAGPETAVFMLSDHGFGARRTLIHVDEWLAGQGLLRYAGGKAGFRKLLKPYMNRLKRLIPRRLLRQGRRAFAVSHVIDWQHTQAYSGVSSEYAIYVNLAGREPFGIVPEGEAYEAVRRQIKAALADLRDPRTGQRVVQAVYDRETAYTGPYVDQAPDIVYVLEPGYEPSSEVSASGVFSDVTAAGEGMHQPDGIFLAYGPPVRDGAVAVKPGLADLAPTILYALGLPVPPGLDGRVLTEIFDPAYCASHPVVFDQTAAQAAAAADVTDAGFSADDEALILERLTALGYLR
ncbi:MAG: alkaline phosphatase family protein [Chloroflexi bacterium]|nr:alkaline phosphatase family protein [Chloroflexota bacterium]